MLLGHQDHLGMMAGMDNEVFKAFLVTEAHLVQEEMPEFIIRDGGKVRVHQLQELN